MIIDEETLELLRRELSDCELFTGISSRSRFKINSNNDKILKILENHPRIQTIRDMESFHNFRFISLRCNDGFNDYRWFLVAIFKDIDGVLLAKLSI